MARRSLDLRSSVRAAVAPGLRLLLFWRRLTAPSLFVASFLLLIAIGTLGLMLIPGLQVGPKLGFVDSVFTMTSAVCVTGLVVADTATQFTGLGQAWILLFIQLGGIGLISLTTLLIGAMGKRLSLRSEMLVAAPIRSEDRPQVWELTVAVTKFSLIVEAVGAVLLFLTWLPDLSVGDAAWAGLFHSVSAYCNAGFSTFTTSLIDHSHNPIALFVVSVLVIMGGLGYLTFNEIVRWWKTARARRAGVRLEITSSRRLSSHTWAVVTTTGVLLVAGWILFAIFEWNQVLGDLSVFDKISNAWFLSVTPRTAGFNNVDYTQVGNDTAALTMLLMFIGGSPGSTAGGIKTTTVAVLVALGLSRFRGRKYVALKERAIPPGTIERTVGIVLVAMFVLAVSFFAISAIEAVGQSAATSRTEFLPIAFEVVSAFATVGLSMNFTSELEAPSKLIVAGLMFVGRVGLFSFLAAVMLRRPQPPGFQRPAQEDLIVG
ncbi:MAG: TrkH family potassium uptake protein [Kofleriaceae bacterium]